MPEIDETKAHQKKVLKRLNDLRNRQEEMSEVMHMVLKLICMLIAITIILPWVK